MKCCKINLAKRNEYCDKINKFAKENVRENEKKKTTKGYWTIVSLFFYRSFQKRLYDNIYKCIGNKKKKESI